MRRLQVIKTLSAANIRYFVWLRLAFGLCLLAIVIERLIDSDFSRLSTWSYIKTLQDNSLFLHSGEIFLTSPWLYNSFLLLFLTLILVYCSGLGGRWLLWVFFAAESLFQILNAGNVYGHQGFIHQFLMLLILVECGQGRIRWRNVWKPSLLSGLAVWLLRWQLMVLYFAAGYSKFLSPDWKSPEIIDRIFTNRLYPDTFFDTIYLALPWLTPLLFWGTLIFQITFPVLVWIRPLRKWVFSFGALFHFCIAAEMQIYGFSFFMVALYLVFIEDEKLSFNSAQNSPSIPMV